SYRIRCSSASTHCHRLVQNPDQFSRVNLHSEVATRCAGNNMAKPAAAEVGGSVAEILLPRSARIRVSVHISPTRYCEEAYNRTKVPGIGLVYAKRGRTKRIVNGIDTGTLTSLLKRYPFCLRPFLPLRGWS